VIFGKKQFKLLQNSFLVNFFIQKGGFHSKRALKTGYMAGRDRATSQSLRILDVVSE
jgi:hypothetical protein